MLKTLSHEEVKTKNITIRPNYAYVAVITSFNVFIITSHISVVASAAPLIGVIAGCGMVYWATQYDDFSSN